MEVNNIRQVERTHKISAKHRWYLIKRHGIIHNLLVPDFMVYEIVSIIGLLAFTTLVQTLMVNSKQYELSLVVLSGVWGINIVLEHITTTNGWKVLNKNGAITKRLI